MICLWVRPVAHTIVDLQSRPSCLIIGCQTGHSFLHELLVNSTLPNGSYGQVMQDRAVVARLVHTQKVGGAIPSPATNPTFLDVVCKYRISSRKVNAR